MRDKVRAAHPVKAELFDVKHSPGGMVDVEFAVQFLVLAHDEQFPTLCGNIGNIGLLLEAQRVGLLPGEIGSDAARAYRLLRQIQHRARLDEQPAQSDSSAAQAARRSVQALWTCVFD